MNWKRACDTNTCLEVAALEDGHGHPLPEGDVLIRSSAFPDAMILATRDEWYEFVSGVKEGRFDSL